MITTCAHHTRRPLRSLLRRVDGIEFPTAGLWTVADRHTTVTFVRPRWLSRPDTWRGRTAQATVAFGAGTDDVAVAVIMDAPGQPTITAMAVGRSSAHRWMLSGSVSADGLILPVQANLDYHGVWRRGDGAHGWFVLTGTIDHGARSKRRVRFSVELLADGPVTETLERGVA